jgi:hypothetical protein
LAVPSDREVPLDVIPEEIHLIRIGNGFTLVPNPAQSWVEIAVDEGEFTQIQITTIEGKILPHIVEHHLKADRLENGQLNVPAHPSVSESHIV